MTHNRYPVENHISRLKAQIASEHHIPTMCEIMHILVCRHYLFASMHCPLPALPALLGEVICSEWLIRHTATLIRGCMGKVIIGHRIAPPREQLAWLEGAGASSSSSASVGGQGWSSVVLNLVFVRRLGGRHLLRRVL